MTRIEPPEQAMVTLMLAVLDHATLRTYWAASDGTVPARRTLIISDVEITINEAEYNAVSAELTRRRKIAVDIAHERASYQ